MGRPSAAWTVAVDHSGEPDTASLPPSPAASPDLEASGVEQHGQLMDKRAGKVDRDGGTQSAGSLPFPFSLTTWPSMATGPGSPP